jgi:hypothetical protein
LIIQTTNPDTMITALRGGELGALINRARPLIGYFAKLP